MNEPKDLFKGPIPAVLLFGVIPAIVTIGGGIAALVPLVMFYLLVGGAIVKIISA